MEKKLQSRDFGAVFTLLFPFIYIVLGALLLFVPDINTKVLAELLGALLLIAGAALIIRYFLRRSYLDMKAYGFSVGTLAAILGICTILKGDEVAGSLSLFLNICIMLTAIIKLQNAIQLKFMKSRAWIPVLCISLVFLLCTVLIIINPFSDSVRNTFTYIVLLCDGIAGFANSILLRTVSRKRNRALETGVIEV